MSRQMLLAIALGTLAVSGACGGSEPAGPGDENQPVVPNAASVDVDPGLGLVTTLGAEIQFTASAKDATGGPLAGTTFTWASSETSVATVGTDGLARGVAEGLATITATVDGVRGSADLWVLPAEHSAADINNSGQIVGTVKRAALVGTEVVEMMWALQHTPSKEWEDLGSFGTVNRSSMARAINEAGDIVGRSGYDSFEDHAFLMSASGGMMDLGTLGGSYSIANAISDARHVAGASINAAGERHAFLWTTEAGMTDLGTLGGEESRAFGVNSLGAVVGQGDTAEGEPHAFLWTADAGMVDLGTLGGASAAANAINDRGQVVGFGQLPDQNTRAVIWEADGSVTDLGTLGMWGSYGNDINGAGDVVGYSYTDSGETHAFSWTAEAGMVDLGTLGGTFSWASAINDMGQIVGTSETAAGESHAFVWTAEAGMVDLGAWAPAAGARTPSLAFSQHQRTGACLDHARSWRQP